MVGDEGLRREVVNGIECLVSWGLAGEYRLSYSYIAVFVIQGYACLSILIDMMKAVS